MLDVVRAAQLPLLALVLIIAGLAKLILPGPAGTFDREVPALRPRYRRGLSTAVALTECGLGAALLVAPAQHVRLLVAAWFAGATWILDELRTRRPEEGCGCFGALSSTRIGLRVIIRPLLLTAAATGTIGVPVTGLEVLGYGLGPCGVLLAVEIGILLALSPEVGVLLARRSRPPCELRPSPLADTYRALHGSRAWREYAPVLTGAGPTQVWREMCWRFLVYPGRLGPADVEVVFAVSLAGEQRPVVRVALAEALPDAAAASAIEATAASRRTDDTWPNPRAFAPA